MTFNNRQTFMTKPPIIIVIAGVIVTMTSSSIISITHSRSCAIRGQLTVWTIEGDFYMSFNGT
jgi:hypothetical protein